jgi:hypothetical protein
VVAEVIGCLIFATIIGTVTSNAVGGKLLEEKVAKRVAELREFMQAKRIPKPLRQRVRWQPSPIYIICV